MTLLEDLDTLRKDFDDYARTAKSIEAMATKYGRALKKIADYEIPDRYVDDYTGCPGLSHFYDDIRDIANKALREHGEH